MVHDGPGQRRGSRVLVSSTLKQGPIVLEPKAKAARSSCTHLKVHGLQSKSEQLGYFLLFMTFTHIS
jgi:hypothetical protein